jgi:hypothetical protein
MGQRLLRRGKSHVVRVFEHYWRILTLPDGTEARNLSTLPTSVTDSLLELTTAGKQRGGLWAAAGRLGGRGDSIRLDMLRIVLESAGLPVEYAPARFVLWLKRIGLYDAVRAEEEKEGVRFGEELGHLYVSPLLAGSLLAALPEFADNQKEARGFIKPQYPKKAELVETVRMVLELQSNKPGELPCTLLASDEMQQKTGEDTVRALEVQAIVEDLCSEFGTRLLVVGTGQSAIQATPQLQELQGRFPVRVELSDRDVDHVVREVVLRKDPTKVQQLGAVLENCSGEIDRHLAGTRVHEATRAVAEREIGTVVGGDFIYEQQKPAMLQSGVLLGDLAAIVEEQKDGTPAGESRSRLCATVFLICRLPTTGAAATGLRANATTLADLLVQDLPGGSAGSRQRVPQLLDELVQNCTLMLVEGEYRLQTRESFEWERDYRQLFGSIRGDTTRIASDRATALRQAVVLNHVALAVAVIPVGGAWRNRDSGWRGRERSLRGPGRGGWPGPGCRR